MNYELPQIAPVAPVKDIYKPIKTGFKLELAFFGELLKRLEEKRNNRSKLFKKVTRPRFGWFNTTPDKRLSFTNLSQGILSDLIETAFWASLELEEGRSLKFSIAYRCFVENEQSTHTFESSDLIFQEPKPFNIRNLVKIAPAIGDDSSVLISSLDNKSLKITGVSIYGSVPLKISVLDPGKLIIKYDMENIAIISGAEVVFIRDSLLVHNSSIWTKLSTKEDKKFPNLSGSKKWVIVNTLRKMRKLGHGGTLIIVPCNKKYQKHIDTPIPYTSSNLFTYGSETLTYIEERRKENKDFLGLDSYIDLAEKFSQFTAVDGATLITRKLDLIGFGVILNKSNRNRKFSKTIYKIDPLDHDEWFKRVELAGLGNTRHQSAARFICSQQDSIAFVVSQDGNVTALVYEKDKERETEALFAYSRLELTLF